MRVVGMGFYKPPLKQKYSRPYERRPAKELYSESLVVGSNISTSKKRLTSNRHAESAHFSLGN